MSAEDKPFMFQLDVFDYAKHILERKRIITSRPVAGTFRVSNGEMLCDITLDRWGVLVRCQNKNGDFEYISTKKVNSVPVAESKA